MLTSTVQNPPPHVKPTCIQSAITNKKTNMSPVNNALRMKKEQADGNLCSIEPDDKQKMELKPVKILI